jgi:hypothetical protein
MKENARYEERKIDRCPTGKRFKTPFVCNISLSAFMSQAIEAKPRLPQSQPLDRTQELCGVGNRCGGGAPWGVTLPHAGNPYTQGHVGGGNSCRWVTL